MEVGEREKRFFIISVTDDYAGLRLDRFLSEKLKEYSISRSQIQKLIEDGNVLLNLRRTRQSVKVAVNDEVTVMFGKKKENILVPEPIKLDIIYEDDSIIVLNKPSGLVVHPAPGHNVGSLVNALIAYTDNLSSIGAPLRPGIVHRLDKDTSGVMVIAKNNFSHLNLASQFMNREVQKLYRCIVAGSVKNDAGRIEKPIGRSEHDRKKFSSRTRSGKISLTEWRVLERFRNFTMLNVLPLTGRTHQIRVHLSEMHYPILGDRVYGGKSALTLPQGIDRTHLYLHAEGIKFKHPVTTKYMEFTASLPDYFARAIEILRRENV
jgi:23S rRNA pseudouridine1911/1915/1917 synthase